MNEIVLKGLLKTVKNMLPPAAIKQAATALITEAVNFKNSVPLNPENGEVATTGIIYEVDNIVYCSLAILNCENHIVRFSETQPLETIIDNLLKKL